MLSLILIALLVGSITGILAGMLGLGGGVIIVPLLDLLLPRFGVEPNLVMHLALGTSLASIIFTSLSSLRAHHKRGAVVWKVWRSMVPGILCGTLAGSLVAGMIPTTPLKILFLCFILWVAWRLFAQQSPRPERELPNRLGLAGSGALIGALSSLVGIGGGSLTVPFLVRHNLPLTKAIGTSAAVGLPIACAGTLGYLVSGWSAPLLPAYSLGYIHLPTLLGIAGASALTAPWGARLAHTLPTRTLKRIFALLLLIVAARMAYNL